MSGALARPGYGTSGKPVKLTTNYFPVTLATQNVHQYHVDFDPPIESSKVRQILLSKALGRSASNGYIFDGQALLFSLSQLPPSTQVEDRNRTVTLLLQSTNATASDECAQVLNVLFKRVLTTVGLIQIGKNHFIPSQANPIPQHGLSVWPGFETAVQPVESGMALMVDTRSKILHTKTVLEMMNQVASRARGDSQAAIADYFRQKIIITKYNNLTYQVEKVDFSRNATWEFDLKGSGKCSLAQYVSDRYGIKIRDKKQPVLICSRKKVGETLILPETCHLTGLPDEMVADFRVMQDLAKFTRIGPRQRIEKVQSLRDSTQDPKAAQMLREWGASVGQDLLELEGRVLPSESIITKTKTIPTDPKRMEWSNAFRDSSPVTSSPFTSNKWVIIYAEQDHEAFQKLQSEMQFLSKQLKCALGRPVVLALPNDRPETFCERLKATLQPDFEMVVCILRGARKERYDKLKHFLCTYMPLPSQCVLTKTLMNQKVARSACMKLYLQMIAKRGVPLLRPFQIIGMDVYHNRKKGDRSVLAFCASLNPSFSQYYSQASFQATGQEISDNLEQMMVNALDYYQRVNKKLPGNVLIFRDGVGDSQLGEVVTHELDQIKRAFTHKGRIDYAPGLGVVVVQKRISTRFFTAQDTNVAAGTIVDRVVTSPTEFDYFLVAHAVTQGTATPTHYKVVYDTIGMPPDILQSLTFKLCHLYYNWQGTIRVPAPCMYAHKQAFLVGQNTQQLTHPSLNHRLYFL